MKMYLLQILAFSLLISDKLRAQIDKYSPGFTYGEVYYGKFNKLGSYGGFSGTYSLYFEPYFANQLMPYFFTIDFNGGGLDRRRVGFMHNYNANFRTSINQFNLGAGYFKTFFNGQLSMFYKLKFGLINLKTTYSVTENFINHYGDEEVVFIEWGPVSRSVRLAAGHEIGFKLHFKDDPYLSLIFAFSQMATTLPAKFGNLQGFSQSDGATHHKKEGFWEQELQSVGTTFSMPIHHEFLRMYNFTIGLSIEF